MAQVSVTRLRLRSLRFLPAFAWHALRSAAQAKKADGNLGVQVRRHSGAFWTLTLWKDAAALRSFMLSGAHKDAMPKLLDWCDEASLAHWQQDALTLPSWDEAEAHLRSDGRTSRVAHPSPAQAAGLTMGSWP